MGSYFDKLRKDLAEKALETYGCFGDKGRSDPEDDEQNSTADGEENGFSPKDIFKLLTAAPLIAPLLVPGIAGATITVLLTVLKMNGGEEKIAETAVELYNKIDKDKLIKIGEVLGSLPVDELADVLQKLPGDMADKISPEAIKKLCDELKQIIPGSDEPGGPENKLPDSNLQNYGPTPP